MYEFPYFLRTIKIMQPLEDLRSLYDLLRTNTYILASWAWFQFIQSMVYLSTYALSGYICQVSVSVKTHWSRYDTHCDSTVWNHQNPLMTSLWSPPVKIVYFGLPSSFLVRHKHVRPLCVLSLSGQGCQISVLVGVFYSYCDTSMTQCDITKNSYDLFLSPPLVNIVYVGFLGSVLVHSKHAIPVCVLFGSVCQVSVSVMTIQLHCDTCRGRTKEGHGRVVGGDAASKGAGKWPVGHGCAAGNIL